MESLQVGGVILFIYGVLWASSTITDAKRALEVEWREALRPIERMTVMNALGPVMPLVAALGVATIAPAQALAAAVLAIIATVALLACRGIVHARRMRGAGVPEIYAASYRKAHVIRAASVALCAAALAHPLLR